MTRRILKYFRITVISLLILAVLSAGTVSLIFYFYPKDSVLVMIKEGAEKTLKRQVQIGSLDYSIRGVLLKDVTIYETTTDGGRVELFKAEEAVISFSILSLLKKDLKIDTVYLKKLYFVWQFEKDGSSNIKRLLTDMAEGKKPSGGSKQIRIKKILLDECTFKLVNPPERYKPLEGEYVVSSAIRIKENNYFKITDTRITLPEKRGEIFPEVEVTTSDGFKITGEAKLTDADITWTYGFAKKKLMLPFHTANGYIDSLEITRTTVKGHAKASCSLRNTSKKITAEGWCTVDLPTKTTYLSDISGDLDGSDVTIENMVIPPVGGIRKFSMRDISADLDDAAVFLPFIIPGVYGHVKGNISYDGRHYSGRIELSDAGYTGNAEFVSDVNTVVDINSGIIKKENIPLKLFGSGCTASVASTDGSFKSFYILLRADRIDTENIKFNKKKGSDSDGTADSGKTAQSSGGPGLNLKVNISGKIQVSEMTYDMLAFRNIVSDFSASGSTIKILSFSASIFGGRVMAAGKIDLSGSVPDTQVQVKYSGIKIQDIGFSNEKMKDRFFGFAEGSASLNFQMKENLLSTVKGSTIFTITRGKVVNTGVQNGLIVFLAELRYKLKDLEFNKIYGNIDINGSQFTINSFIFNAEDVRLMLTGNIDSDLNAKNMSMKLEFNQHFIKDIPRPAVTVMGEYASGSWYIIPFIINGNITDSKNIKMLKAEK